MSGRSPRTGAHRRGAAFSPGSLLSFSVTDYCCLLANATRPVTVLGPEGVRFIKQVSALAVRFLTMFSPKLSQHFLPSVCFLMTTTAKKSHVGRVVVKSIAVNMVPVIGRLLAAPLAQLRHGEPTPSEFPTSGFGL